MLVVRPAGPADLELADGTDDLDLEWRLGERAADGDDVLEVVAHLHRGRTFPAEGHHDSDPGADSAPPHFAPMCPRPYVAPRPRPQERGSRDGGAVGPGTRGTPCVVMHGRNCPTLHHP